MNKSKTVSFIINGKNKSNKRLMAMITAKLADQHTLNFLETTGTGDAIKLASETIKKGTNYLIAVGGDGLLNEVTNGYMHADAALRKEVIVGTFPYGTGNDFTKSVGIIADFEQLAKLIETNTSQHVDVGYMTHVNLDRQRSNRYFINITDIGIGGYTAKRVNESSKTFGPDFSYMKAIILSFLTYKHRKIKLTSTDFEWEGSILAVCMANGKFFGSGMCIAPQAEVDDGLIQLVILGNVTLLDYIKNLSKIRKGQVLDHPGVQYQKVTSCKIETIEECTIDMDGEFIGYGPIEVSILKQEMKFLRG